MPYGYFNCTSYAVVSYNRYTIIKTLRVQSTFMVKLWSLFLQTSVNESRLRINGRSFWGMHPSLTLKRHFWRPVRSQCRLRPIRGAMSSSWNHKFSLLWQLLFGIAVVNLTTVNIVFASICRIRLLLTVVGRAHCQL